MYPKNKMLLEFRGELQGRGQRGPQSLVAFFSPTSI